MASTKPVINMGTRSSALALKQAVTVQAALAKANPEYEFVIDARETAGDRDKITPLPNLGKGLWTSDFEVKLADGSLDLVVHCVKDMSTTLPEGCILGAISEREDPRDAVIFAPGSPYKTIADLPAGSIVGTSSVRRSAGLRRRYPGLKFKDLRGNVDTRLRKLDIPQAGADGEIVKYDCIILAAAGLNRMNMQSRISQLLDSATAGTLYAVGQGALAIEIREGDEKVLKLLEPINDPPTQLACWAERAVMRKLEGGCSVPIGVETTWLPDNKLRLEATVISLDGKQAVDADVTGVVTTLEEADELGHKAAANLVSLGAQEILDEINRNKVIVPPVPAPVK